jgi:hypothetical protein
VKTPGPSPVSGSSTLGERIFARWHQWLDRRAEPAELGRLRARALAGVRGGTLEVGGGHGANLAHHPAGAGPLVLADGGRLHFLEHARASDASWLARAQDVGETPHRIIGGGCRLNRRTEAAIRASPELKIAELGAGRLPSLLPLVSPYISGTAVREARSSSSNSSGA